MQQNATEWNQIYRIEPIATKSNRNSNLQPNKQRRTVSNKKNTIPTKSDKNTTQSNN